MHQRYDRLTRQVTSVALAASALLVGLGIAGYTPSILWALAGAGVAASLAVGREFLAALGSHEAFEIHAETLWIGPALAAVVLVLFGDLTPGELQTVGALIGLLGMANYLLRPLYLLVGSLLSRATRAV